MVLLLLFLNMLLHLLLTLLHRNLKLLLNCSRQFLPKLFLLNSRILLDNADPVGFLRVGILNLSDSKLIVYLFQGQFLVSGSGSLEHD